MGPYLIGAHKAEDPVRLNSDYVHVVSNRCRHKNSVRPHCIPPLCGTLTLSLTAQQFRLVHVVLRFVPWKQRARSWAAPDLYLKVCCVFLIVRGPERLTIDARL
jgi:hypothetical protein